MDCPDELVPFENATKVGVLGLYQGRSTADLEEAIQPCGPVIQIIYIPSSNPTIEPRFSNPANFTLEILNSGCESGTTSCSVIIRDWTLAIHFTFAGLRPAQPREAIGEVGGVSVRFKGGGCDDAAPWLPHDSFFRAVTLHIRDERFRGGTLLVLYVTAGKELAMHYPCDANFYSASGCNIPCTVPQAGLAQENLFRKDGTLRSKASPRLFNAHVDPSAALSYFRELCSSFTDGPPDVIDNFPQDVTRLVRSQGGPAVTFPATLQVALEP
ncbi:uncharacterized protein LACBIDRAFT_327471 [Laccaria bicolor S238N-H82]|uniref:Predicted protein n=1 Tax=Laccaria bicolor (strain S238N-H82 / ATCC MYA-4686) TaxID=486041 RepID=B0DB69_LACBS|nr:uncharacterized protein LACBIDRAFT_327471 [Laccaria bicolor S238N-H82]EDR08339.1 predicted protein [Laccaria bicolor S238N-H82]|eukprot:XP_001881409.1 predicted protein [Laccaria bicolor S238N-H82]